MEKRKAANKAMPSPVLAGLVADAPPRVSPALPVIERGVPVQKKVLSGRVSPYRRFVEAMEPGDSILVPEAEAHRYLNPLRQKVYKHGWAIVSRRDGQGSVRIWRTA